MLAENPALVLLGAVALYGAVMLAVRLVRFFLARDRVLYLLECEEQRREEAAALQKRITEGRVSITFDNDVLFIDERGNGLRVPALRLMQFRGVITIDVGVAYVVAMCDMEAVRALEAGEDVVLPRACFASKTAIVDAFGDRLEAPDDVD